MTTRQYSSRSQQSTLTAAITAGATSMVVVSGTALLGGVSIPAGTTFTLVIDPDTALEEIVDASAVSTNTFTITRSVDTVGGAQAHSAGAVVRHMAIGRDFRDANRHAEADASYNDGGGNAHSLHGIASGEGVVVGTLKTQTLTNKTLTSPTISNPTLTGTPSAEASIVFEGATADAHETTLTVVDPTQDNTITLPNTSGTVTINDATQTLTNKTLTSPVLSGTPVITGLSSAGMVDSSATPKNYVDSILGSATAAATSAASAATSASSAATSASSASTSASSASTSASSAATSATAAATSASSAATSATAAATSATSAAASATAATTSATSADTSATAAATSASSASTSASSALTSANSASTSASSAATSASSASTSASSAATSASSAAASYDEFDDRYLGSKTSDPTVDNDGNPLITGALYFNSVTNAMKVYSGSSWGNVAPDTSNFIDKSILSGKGALISASGASTPVALTAPSTNGWILSGDSATTSGLAWIAPNPGDITGVTAGDGISGGGTSGDVSIAVDSTVLRTTGGQVISANTSANAFEIRQTGTGGAFVVEDDTNPDATQFKISSDGRVVIGDDTPQTSTILTIEAPTEATSGVNIRIDQDATPTGEWNPLSLNANAQSTGQPVHLGWEWDSITATAGPAISGVKDSTTAAHLRFYTTEADARVERVRIGSNGDLTLNSPGKFIGDGSQLTGITTPGGTFKIASGSNAGTATYTISLPAGGYLVESYSDQGPDSGVAAINATFGSTTYSNMAWSTTGQLRGGRTVPVIVPTTGSLSSITIDSAPSGIWSSRAISGFGTTRPSLSAMVFGSNTFVTVGVVGSGAGTRPYICTSTDGLTWVSRTPTGFGNTNIDNLGFGNGIFFGMDWAGNIATSADGVTWTSRANTMNAAANNGSVSGYVAGINTPYYLLGSGGSGTVPGQAGMANVSTNGTTWTTRTIGSGSSGVRYTGVAGSNNFATVKVIVTQGGGVSPLSSYMTSTDGVTWTSRPFGTTIAQGAIGCVATDGSKYIMVQSSKVYSSTDGITWTVAASGPMFNGTLGSLSYNATPTAKWAMFNSNSNKIMTSTDGITWNSHLSGTQGLPTGDGGSAWINNLYNNVFAYGAGNWVALPDASNLKTAVDPSGNGTLQGDLYGTITSAGAVTTL